MSTSVVQDPVIWILLPLFVSLRCHRQLQSCSSTVCRTQGKTPCWSASPPAATRSESRAPALWCEGLSPQISQYFLFLLTLSLKDKFKIRNICSLCRAWRLCGVSQKKGIHFIFLFPFCLFAWMKPKNWDLTFYKTFIHKYLVLLFSCAARNVLFSNIKGLHTN